MDEILKKSFSIPENIAKYISEHDGVNLSVNYNSAGADDGYSHMIWHTVVMTRITRTCSRCGYDPLWNPDDTNSKCMRHSYGAYRYDEVFAWSPIENDETLAQCFDQWIDQQPTRWDDPTVKMSFGRFGYR